MVWRATTLMDLSRSVPAPFLEISSGFGLYLFILVVVEGKGMVLGGNCEWWLQLPDDGRASMNSLLPVADGDGYCGLWDPSDTTFYPGDLGGWGSSDSKTKSADHYMAAICSDVTIC
ncbi:hypothetical protein RchiOBHm_Chr2g0137221 [Rosa chinensis]|uniref:Uncharacterized protein n=1 Tax=Rosa chinensis TaxID=74649 RepID=A0A2P6RWK4_ROSCH|nr:hypothetical protein RchiOBHm_Chr2g0137221 [Rosa chinensis]